MKSKLCILCILLLLFANVASAEQVTANASIVAPSTRKIMAPFSGTLLPFDWQNADTVTAEDVLFSFDTVKVYATQTGTVSAIFAEPGDDTVGIIDRYQALCVIEPEYPLYIDASTKQAYDDEENKYLHVGEMLYLKKGDKKGTGRVTSVDGENYTVEILSGDYDVDDSVQCYRESGHDNDSKTGQGDVVRYPDTRLTAEGRVLRVHKQQGDAVAAGDLVFEMVAADSAPQTTDTDIAAGVNGVLSAMQVQPGAQVYMGQYLCEIIDPAVMELSVEVDEMDIASIRTGDSYSFTLDAFPGERFSGTVLRIMPVGTMKQNATYYDVRLTLPETGHAFMIGMNGTVTLRESGTESE